MWKETYKEQGDFVPLFWEYLIYLLFQIRIHVEVMGFFFDWEVMGFRYKDERNNKTPNPG
jgi:hypothetical protein